MVRVVLLAAAALAACAPVPVDPARVAARCEARARTALGPQTAVSIGASSDDGPFAGVGVGLSGDFLTGRDPRDVYESCVREATGAAPVRPLAL